MRTLGEISARPIIAIRSRWLPALVAMKRHNADTHGPVESVAFGANESLAPWETGQRPLIAAIAANETTGTRETSVGDLQPRPRQAKPRTAHSDRRKRHRRPSAGSGISGDSSDIARNALSRNPPRSPSSKPVKRSPTRIDCPKTFCFSGSIHLTPMRPCRSLNFRKMQRSL